jgi:hypothetical protein
MEDLLPHERHYPITSSRMALAIALIMHLFAVQFFQYLQVYRICIICIEPLSIGSVQLLRIFLLYRLEEWSDRKGSIA